MAAVAFTACTIQLTLAEDGQFSVVSIHPSDPHAPVTPRRMDPTTFDSTDNLKVFIALAYGVETFQIIGGPSWIGSTPYHVVARTESPASPEQIRHMVVTMLRDRFQLRVHNSSQLMSAYALSGSKSPRLTASGPGTPRDGAGAISTGADGLITRGASMGLLARYLSVELGRPVLDKTALAKIYDIRLKFDPASPGDSSGWEASLITALGEAGLKLKAEKSQVPVLVVDQAEFPSAN